MIASAFTKKTIAVTTEAWSRPADWLALPAVPAQGLVGLCGVWETLPYNYVAVRARSNVAATSGGGYLVDWGDGSAPQEYAENTTASKLLDWNSYSSNTLSSRGYRQAIIKILPKSGQNLTNILLQAHPSKGNLPSPWLDVEINGTTALTAVQIGQTSSIFLERAKIHSLGNTTTLANLFNGCLALQEVILPSTAKITSMASMYSGCYALQAAPAVDTTNVTTMASMFSGCINLRSVPTLNTAKTTSMASMFQSCHSLEQVQSSFNTTACTTMASAFNGCFKLKNAPSFTDTSKVTNMSNMFLSCFSLTSAPSMNCLNVTTAASMFNGCYVLKEIPAYNFAKATALNGFIKSALQLKTIAHLSFSSTCGNYSEFCNGARSLSAIPALNLGSSTNNGLAFYGASTLTSIPVTGAKVNIDIRYCSLDAAALNQVFTSLANLTGLTAKTIYVRGNRGVDASGYDATIATSKNWVVDKTTA
jgi:surface protein